MIRGGIKLDTVVKKQEVRSAGNEIIGYAEDLTNYINQFQSIIDSVNNVWQGADALRYINFMRDQYTPKLLLFKSMLEEYGLYLKKIPEAYEVLDETFSSRKIDV